MRVVFRLVISAGLVAVLLHAVSIACRADPGGAQTQAAGVPPTTDRVALGAMVEQALRVLPWGVCHGGRVGIASATSGTSNRSDAILR